MSTDEGISLIREEKSWFRKFVDVWKNPQFGHVVLNKKSQNVNIYLGFKKLRGKVLLWSPLRKTR